MLIDTLHSSSTGGWERRLGYRASDWLTDRVTTVSHAVADAHLAAHFTCASKLTIVPNGVDLEASSSHSALRNASRLALGIEEEFLWLAAGRLEPVKDYPTLLHALACSPGKAHLAIAGDGTLAAALRRRAALLNLRDRVHFLGFCPEIRRDCRRRTHSFSHPYGKVSPWHCSRQEPQGCPVWPQTFPEPVRPS